MKSAIPREIVYPSGSFEKDDGLTTCGWRAAGDKLRHARDLEIVEPADKSTFETLGVEIFEHTFFHMSLRGAMPWRRHPHSRFAQQIALAPGAHLPWRAVPGSVRQVQGSISHLVI